MGDILAKTFSLILIIIITYLLKQKGVFKESDKDFLSKILITVNLPCVIISGFKNYTFNSSATIAILLGMLTNAIALFIAYFISKKNNNELKTLKMMCIAGYNIGIMSLPFIMTFLPESAFVSVMLFDMGNALFVFGTSFAITKMVVNKEKTNPLTAILKKIFSSVPFITYIVMLLTLIFNIKLPSTIYYFTDIGKDATVFLGMVIIGIMLDFKFNFKEIKELFSVVRLRYIYAVALAIILFLLPLDVPPEEKKGFILCVFAPISTSSVVYMVQMKCSSRKIGLISSICTIISLIFMILVVLFI